MHGDPLSWLDSLSNGSTFYIRSLEDQHKRIYARDVELMATDIWEFDINGKTARQRLRDADSFLANAIVDRAVSGQPAGTKDITIYDADGTTVKAVLRIDSDSENRTVIQLLEDS